MRRPRWLCTSMTGADARLISCAGRRSIGSGGSGEAGCVASFFPLASPRRCRPAATSTSRPGVDQRHQQRTIQVLRQLASRFSSRLHICVRRSSHFYGTRGQWLRHPDRLGYGPWVSHAPRVLRLWIVLKRRRLWPYLGVVDASGRGTGWCGLSGPLRQQSDLDRYDALRRRTFRFVGFTSYLTFPALAEGLLSDYGELCDGWCCCFRQPQDYISPGLPTALISESDFVDYRFISPREICGRDDPAKEFDFIYVCLPGSWAEMTKNWALAKACLHHLCYDLDLRGLLLGRWQILDLPFRHNLTVVGDMPRREVLQYLGRSPLRFRAERDRRFASYSCGSAMHGRSDSCEPGDFGWLEVRG